MFDLFFTIHDETMYVMIPDRYVLRVRLYLRIKREFGRPLTVFVNCDWIFENTAQHRQDVSLNIEYEFNLFYKTHKS